MQTKVVKVDPAEIDSAEIKEAARLIDAGGLVAFPTETVYGIGCRVENSSLARLNKLKGRAVGKYYTLHIGRKGDIAKYLPTVGLRAEKLVRGGWPGPLTIVFELDSSDIDKQRDKLDREVFENLYKDNSIGVRCPDNAVAVALLQAASSAVVAPSANVTGRPPATDGGEVLAQFSGQIELLLDAGQCRYKKSSTVVKIGKNGLEILRDGVYSLPELEAMSQVGFLLVCTGNTCRSAMAEGMFRKYLAEKLQCKVDRLEEKGYKIFSAGIMDMTGMPASPEAVAACAAKGIDIRNHKSRALSRQLVEESDFIFVMAGMHRERVVAFSGEAASKCVLLAGEVEIADPIGQPREVYNSCCDLIEKAVKKRISGLVI